LQEALDGFKKKLTIELICLSLEQAATSLNDILGGNTSEDLQKTIFSNFCIGK
jgi:tRNA U34 5-carboxymethylaminomethyl modifying GTPase MnmE/TrmE